MWFILLEQQFGPVLWVLLHASGSPIPDLSSALNTHVAWENSPALRSTFPWPQTEESGLTLGRSLPSFTFKAKSKRTPHSLTSCHQ